jgi:hypothetical protein
MIRTSGFQRGFVIELQYIKNTSHPKEKKQISNLVHMSCGTPVSSNNKTDRHDITEILLKVALNTIN